MMTSVLTRSHAAAVFCGVSLLFVSAQIQIPLQPVPITLQTLSVLLLGLVFSRQAAMQSVLGYLTLGAAGLPVFAGFSNLALIGPRVGYVLGFLGAVWVMTYLRDQLSDLALCLIGSTIIFVCGVSVLAAFIGLNQALSLGFVPFLLPELLKSVLLAGALKFLRI